MVRRFARPVNVADRSLAVAKRSWCGLGWMEVLTVARSVVAQMTNDQTVMNGWS